MAKLQKKYFTSDGTWTAPAGVTEVLLIACGGGGGGGAAYHIGGTNGGGGGNGAIQTMAYVSVTPNTSYTVTIGTGGTGGSPPSPGNNGGVTSFGTLFYSRGGQGGLEGLTTNINKYLSNCAPSSGYYFYVPTNPSAGFGATTLGPNNNGDDGMPNWVGNGSYTGGTGGAKNGTTTSGGGGGGAGPQGSGANGGAAVASGTPNNGSNASANTGAGGGGGGGTGAGGAAGGSGGNGGSGYLYVIWVD